MATVVDSKGVEDHAISRLATFICESGYRGIVYKSEQERSIRAMFEEALRRSRRESILFQPTLEDFVPDTSDVGESQSDGKVENET